MKDIANRHDTKSWRTVSTITVAIVFLAALSACTEKSNVRDNIYRGMYDGMNMVHDMNYEDTTQPPGEDPPNYERYKEEREKALQD